MANVASDGDFSPFEGVDRCLLVLEGDGLLLRFSGEAWFALTTDSAPLAFAGERSVECRLLGGAVTDFNVMTRRGRYRQQLFPVSLLPQQTVHGSAWRTLLLALDDGAEFGLAGAPQILSRFDAVVLEQNEDSLLWSTCPHRFMQIRLDPE